MNCNKIIVLITVLALSVSCKNKHNNDDKAIFHYNEPAGIATLDPAFAKDQALIWATSQLFNGLVRLDTNLNIEPCIAKSWSISDDSRTYTFTLRDDVYFHKNSVFKTNDSTRKVTAYDFLYSFNRITDPKVASPGGWIFSNVEQNGFQAINDTTFVVKLKAPFAPMLSLLAMPYCSVVPREAVDHFGSDFRCNPVGTGPFRFQYWKEGVKLVLRRNDIYFEKDLNGAQLPYLDAVAVTFIVDKQTAFLEFAKGNLDFMNSIDPSYKDELLTRYGELKPKYKDRVTLTSLPFLNTEYLGFKMDSTTILNDVRIRQAISMGFDRRKMIKYMRNNIGYPGCGGMIPLGLCTADEPEYGYDYNPEKARRLLAEAGFPNGQGLEPLHLTTTSTYLDLCKYIQQQLSLIGIDVRIDVTPPAELRQMIAQGRTAWFRGSWIADYPDAENYLSLFVSDNFTPQGPNYTHYKSKKYDALYKLSATENDPVRRNELYQRMDSLVMVDAPVIVLYYDQILHFTQPNVSGIRTNAMNALDLRFVTKQSKHTVK